MKNESMPKSRVMERLFELKQQFHATGDMGPIIGDLEWYLQSRGGGKTESDESNAGLTSTMEKAYGDFSDQELSELIDRLKAD